MASRASSRSKVPADKAKAKISRKDLTEKEKKEKEMRAKQAFMSPGYNSEGVEKLSKALASRTNEHGPTRILPSGVSHDASFVQGAGDGTAKYSGKVGNDDRSRVDTAYRVIADHLRIVSAATSYCAQRGLGTEHREDLLKHADRRAVVFGHKILDTKLRGNAVIVNTALRLSGFYPTQIEAKIASIVEDEVKIYQKIRAKDEQGYVDCNPAMTDSNLHPSLPQRKKEKKNKKDQRGKQQQKKAPT